MENVKSQPAQLVLFGGPARSGKSTLMKAWCATRKRSVHIELDEIRGLIVAGYGDPRIPGGVQREQAFLSIGACCALGREFLNAGYDVASDDVMFPGTFDTSWRSNLAGIEWRLVIIHPTLEETLARSSSREKSVPDHLIREQHQETSGWPERYKIDTTGLSIGDSLKLVEAALIQ